MLVLLTVILLISKINSDDVVINPQIIDEGLSGKYLSKSKDLISKRKQQDIDKTNKPEADTSIEIPHLEVDGESEFPLDVERGKALLENRDAEINGQNKGIKRFIQNNDSIFSPLLGRNYNDKLRGNPISKVDLKRTNKGNRIKIKKAKQTKRNEFEKPECNKSKTNIQTRNAKTDKEEMLSDLIELKPALNELIIEQSYKTHDNFESSEHKPHKECSQNNRLKLPAGYTQNILSEEGEEEDNNQGFQSSQISENELSYKGETQESHLASVSSLTDQEHTSNTTTAGESKTLTVKREFVNIINKNTDQSNNKPGTTVNVDDIKFFLQDRPVKNEEDQDSSGNYSSFKKGTTKDICESMLLNISRGQKLLGQSEDELNSKGKNHLYSEVTIKCSTNPIDLEKVDRSHGNDYSSTPSCKPDQSRHSTDGINLISFLLGLPSEQPVVMNTPETKETVQNIDLYGMLSVDNPISTPSLKSSPEELHSTLGHFTGILQPVIQFPTTNQIPTNPVMSNILNILNDSKHDTEKPDTPKNSQKELETPKSEERLSQVNKNDSNCRPNLKYCISLIGELCSNCPKCNQKNIENSEVTETSNDRARQYNLLAHSTEPTPNLEMCLPKPMKAERPHYTFLPLKNDEQTPDSIFNADHKTVTKHQKQTLYFVSGEPKITDKKMNQLLKKLTKSTTVSNMFKSEVKQKQQLKFGEAKTSSQAPLLKRILGGQSVKKVTKKPSQASGTDACIMIKTHPRRHKGGDPGNHYFHGKLQTTVVCEPSALATKIPQKTNECISTPSYEENEPKNQAANQQTVLQEKKTINLTNPYKNKICKECDGNNELKDILPQSPNKNHQFLVD